MASNHSRHSLRGGLALFGVDGLGGPEAVDLAAQEQEAEPGGADDLFVFIGGDQGIDQLGNDVQVAGVRERPGGHPANADVSVGEHLAKSNLERTKRRRAFRVVPVDHAGHRGIGLLGRGSSSTASIPSIAPFMGRLTTRPPATVIDERSLGSSRPPSSVPAPSRLIVIFWIVLAVDLTRNRIAQTVFISIPCWLCHEPSVCWVDRMKSRPFAYQSTLPSVWLSARAPIRSTP